MSIHVYVCERSEIDSLKKMLAYDPYLDPNVIPHSAENDIKKMSDDEKKHAEEEDKRVNENLARLKNDKFFDVIFARQEYEILDGTSLDLDRDKYYLYLKANDQFLENADKKLESNFKRVKRADRAIEEKVIKFIDERNNKANAGFGSIFG